MLQIDGICSEIMTNVVMVLGLCSWSVRMARFTKWPIGTGPKSEKKGSATRSWSQCDLFCSCSR